MKKIIKNTFFLTIPSIILAFVLLEFVFRVIIPASDHPNACFDEANIIYKFCLDAGEGVATFGKFANQRGRWRINNHGWNSPIDYYEKKEKPTIAIIGDSYIEAWQVDVEKSYPSLLRNVIGDKYNIYSFGFSGAPLSEYLNISRYVNKHFNPNVLIFNIVYNDFDESIFELNSSGTHMLMLSIHGDSITETVPKPNYSFTQYSLTKRFLKKSAVVRYLTYNLSLKQTITNFFSKKTYKEHIEFDRVEMKNNLIMQATDYVLERIKKENVGRRIIFVMNAPLNDIYEGIPLVQSKILMLNRMVGELCQRYGFEFIDLTEPMKKDYDTYHTSFTGKEDGHWGEYGHQFVSKQILKLGFP